MIEVNDAAKMLRVLKMTPVEYVERVMEVLDTFDYSNLVSGFEPLQVAMTLFETQKLCKSLLQSPEFCAVLIWSLTMNYQILPKLRDKAAMPYARGSQTIH